MPQDLRSLLDDSEPAVWIRLGLSLIDLTCVRELFEDCGGVPYEPRAMLGILMLAYFEGETGSRTIEKRLRRDIAYMHVAYGLKPDDRTIRRYRRRFAPVLPKIFELIVQACRAQGLLPMRRVAVDSTKMASSASQIGKWLTNAEREDVESMGFEPPERSDPDARNLGGRSGFVLGYNGQAAVDCDSGVVVAADLDNVSSDGHQLAPMVSQVIANAGAAPEEVVADAGYDTNEGVHVCAEAGVRATVAPHDHNPLFWTVAEEGRILCPMGQEALPSGGLSKNGAGKMYRTLRVKGCGSCPFARECLGSSNSRTLMYPDGVDPVHRLLAAHRARSPEGKAAMRERMACVEPVFGDIKWNKGLGRFRLSGLAGARLEWQLIHMARNVVKLGASLRSHFLDFLAHLLKFYGHTVRLGQLSAAS